MKTLKSYEFEFKRADSKNKYKISDPYKLDFNNTQQDTKSYTSVEDKEYFKNKIFNLESRIRELEKSFKVIEEFFKMYQTQQDIQEKEQIENNKISSDIYEKIELIQKNFEDCKNLFYSNYFDDALNEKLNPFQKRMESNLDRVKMAVNTLNENYLEMQNEFDCFREKLNVINTEQSTKIIQNFLESNDKNIGGNNYLENSQRYSEENENIKSGDYDNSDTEEEKFMKNIRIRK